MEGREGRPSRRAPVAAFTAALVCGDAEAAARIATGFLGAQGSRAAVITDLFQPAQYEIGERWYQGLLSITDEHRATAIVEALGRDLPPTPSANPVPPPARALLAAVPGERHVVGLRFVAMALEDDGWSVIQLAAPASRADLLAAAAAARPQVVGLTAADAGSVPELTTTITELSWRHLPVVVGGPLFNRAPDLWRQVGARGHGSDARMAAVLFRRLR